MPDPIPPRLAWAFHRLAANPAEHLLEVGCGHGVLAGLVAEKLTTGTLTAIDRSKKMIAVAETRNMVHVEAGRISFHTLALADAGLGDGRFDRVFAVNVNLFWVNATRELDRLRSLLKPGADLELFYEPPGMAQVEKVLSLLNGKLEAGGFRVTSRLIVPLGKASGIHVTARPG